MRYQEEVRNSPSSRRMFLGRALGLAAGFGVLLASIRQAAAKMAQSVAGYQEQSTKDGQQCSACSLFQPPNACQLIDGTINPSGWCRYFVKKPG